MMRTRTDRAAERLVAGATSTRASRLKTIAVLALLTGIGFLATGCYDDPYYYGHRNVRAGYYASYVAPAPYYAYDPYAYGYGYGPGVGIGISSYRSYPAYGRRPYYGRYRYGRSGYYRRSDGTNWDRRGYRNRDRRGERRATSGSNRVIRRSTAPAQTDRRGAPVETQPE